MKTIPIKEGMTDAIVKELAQCNLFKELDAVDLAEIAGSAEMFQYDSNEVIMNQGDKSDSFFLVVSGEVIIQTRHSDRDEMVDIARVKPYNTIGELGLLLEEPRSATVVAADEAAVLKFDKQFFSNMFSKLPGFGLVTCRVLADRLAHSSKKMPLPVVTEKEIKADATITSMLPQAFVERYKTIPLSLENNILTVGFVDDPTPRVMDLIKGLLPGMEIRSCSVSNETFMTVAKPRPSLIQSEEAKDSARTAPVKTIRKEVKSRSPKLDDLLKRMVAEGASDVHISSDHRPHWRIDGDMSEISDTEILDSTAIMKLIEPIMSERNRAEFAADNDTDFAYAIHDVSRFRVNVFRDNHGAGVVLRQIPEKIMTIEQLGLPPLISKLCDFPKGLILVTGPTGSGKSTTLAAMIHHVNITRSDHIITLEDPVEFVHDSRKCLVNQREVGPHTKTFARALRAALREDPDIVLVGEMRDLETVSLALETANTGHLVFGTLHTNTAVSTLSRIIDMFPSGQQNQIRTVLADNLKGVVAQTLCKRIGGGRIAALEIMVPDIGMSSIIREGKTEQLFSAMQTGKARGNRILNDELQRLVSEKMISPEEALAKAVDKDDMEKRMARIKGQ